MSETRELTKQERAWVRRLRRVMRDRPEGLWLYADGNLYVMVAGENGEQVMDSYGGVDSAYCVETIVRACEGGGW